MSKIKNILAIFKILIQKLKNLKDFLKKLFKELKNLKNLKQFLNFLMFFHVDLKDFLIIQKKEKSPKATGFVASSI